MVATLVGVTKDLLMRQDQPLTPFPPSLTTAFFTFIYNIPNGDVRLKDGIGTFHTEM